MKKLFYSGLLLWLAFELANVYFIMPMPGSQRMDSVTLAYYLYSFRWVLRGIFFAMMVYGYFKATWRRRWVPIMPLLLISVPVYFINFKMSADHMFRQPHTLLYAGAADNKVDTARLVTGLVINNDARAYPIQFMGYHHIVQDTIGGKPVLITYCTVCRTGRAYDPVIDGRHETFRLVGMDHFNAMVEDKSTGTWWRQATGTAVAGKRKGLQMNEVFSTQTSLGEWLRLHPNSRIMQADPAFIASYGNGYNYESGKSKSSLTGTDSLSWGDKSWVVGVSAGSVTKAYDWNLLKTARVIHDQAGEKNIAIVLADGDKSFFAFSLPDKQQLELRQGTIYYGGHSYRIDGAGIDTSNSLPRLPAYQEFWHSWRTFHPATLVYK